MSISRMTAVAAASSALACTININPVYTPQGKDLKSSGDDAHTKAQLHTSDKPHHKKEIDPQGTRPVESEVKIDRPDQHPVKLEDLRDYVEGAIINKCGIFLNYLHPIGVDFRWSEEGVKIVSDHSSTFRSCVEKALEGVKVNDSNQGGGFHIDLKRPRCKKREDEKGFQGRVEDAIIKECGIFLNYLHPIGVDFRWSEEGVKIVSDHSSTFRSCVEEALDGIEVDNTTSQGQLRSELILTKCEKIVSRIR